MLGIILSFSYNLFKHYTPEGYSNFTNNKWKKKSWEILKEFKYEGNQKVLWIIAWEVALLTGVRDEICMQPFSQTLQQKPVSSWKSPLLFFFVVVGFLNTPLG